MMKSRVQELNLSTANYEFAAFPLGQPWEFGATGWLLSKIACKHRGFFGTISAHDDSARDGWIGWIGWTELTWVELTQGLTASSVPRFVSGSVLKPHLQAPALQPRLSCVTADAFASGATASDAPLGRSNQ